MTLKIEECDIMERSCDISKCGFYFGFTIKCSMHMASFKALSCPKQNKLGGGAESALLEHPMP